jgi:hypothetical protein
MNNTSWSVEGVPLLHHPLGEEAAFTPHALIAAVKRARRLPDTAVPAVCVLECDGNLTDWLVAGHVARPWPTWAAPLTTRANRSTGALTSKAVTC